MSEQAARAAGSEELRALDAMRRSHSEAFSIIGTELAELKAMLMALLDLQKSALFATGVKESDLEANVETLIEGYRQRYLSVMTERIKRAADRE
jgi:hypothetical protein